MKYKTLEVTDMSYTKKELRKTKERNSIFIYTQLIALCLLVIMGFDKPSSEPEFEFSPMHEFSKEPLDIESFQFVKEMREQRVLEQKKKKEEEMIAKRKQKYAHLDNEYNQYLIAKLIASEYGSQKEEDLEKKIAVGLVVLNRVLSEDFPNTVEEVIFQKNQFQPIANGSWQRKEPTEFDYLAAKKALANETVVDASGKEINNAVYFMNPDISSPKNVKWFREALTYVGVLGEHEFYY